VITFHVPGVPAPQGSGTARSSGRKHWVDTGAHDPKKPLGQWRALVSLAAHQAMAGRPPIAGPVVVAAIFTMPRPKSYPKKRWAATSKPDKDKLERAMLDSMSKIVFVDDSQVVSSRTSKVLEGDYLNLASAAPGLSVVVVAMEGTEQSLEGAINLAWSELIRPRRKIS
jgi:crossover junction endodeoxyribonuclease RusA